MVVFLCSFTVKPVSSEAAHLMSQLSTQLQQLATRTSDITSSGNETGHANVSFSNPVSSEGFDLPPPPPDSMFTGVDDSRPSTNNPNVPANQDALLTAIKRSIEMRAARANTRDSSGLSRPS
ncbi:hypothetical protein D915_010862 [Fasciola hepatica]|uniref:Uncharacterized protein n=1 Tax=Fasciola hepatica TaxID=6192 RepID=A0A4E0RUV4_FASHE|nr:hypothetical protein D915_010862 [Fasciola hepatica]